MAKLRDASAYRRLKIPYTRRSRVKSKSYIKSIPHNKIVRYVLGNKSKKFQYRVDLISKDSMNLRHNAIEAGRKAASNYLQKELGLENYRVQVKTHPHHILRENPLATGAGADRFSTGMQKAFGKPIGLASRVKEGKILTSVFVDNKYIKNAKIALKKMSHKYPMKTSIDIIKIE